MSKAFIFGVGGNNENGNSVDRSLKKILDYKQSSAHLFNNYNETTDFRGVIKYSDTENVKNMNSMFSGCTNLTTVPLLDTSSATNVSRMFYECTKLATVPLFNTGNVTDMSFMFYYCVRLNQVPLFDTSNVANMSYMFYQCSSLTTTPLFDTSNVTDMSDMFRSCSNLTTVSLLNSNKVADTSQMFYECIKLTTVLGLDMRKATDTRSMFYGCNNLTDVRIKNIRSNLTISGTNNWSLYGHLLTMDSLLNLLNETVYSSTSKTLTLGATNLAKFTGDYEYVKKTGKLLDLDDNETNVIVSGQTKIPVTWCSSTDEGAMKVADYMSSKGWALA